MLTIYVFTTQLVISATSPGSMVAMKCGRTPDGMPQVTAKALIATLRSLKRLKVVRAAGMMTYVVIGR